MPVEADDLIIAEWERRRGMPEESRTQHLGFLRFSALALPAHAVSPANGEVAMSPPSPNDGTSTPMALASEMST
jgi:hypothetical protein